MPAVEPQTGLKAEPRLTDPMAEDQATVLVKCGWTARKTPALDAMLDAALLKDESWAIAPELVVTMVNIVTGRRLRVPDEVDFGFLSDLLALLDAYGQLMFAAPFMPKWLCLLRRDDRKLLIRTWRGVHVAWLTADAGRLCLCVEDMAQKCRATADGELIDAEGMTYGTSQFDLPPWLPLDIANLRARNFNNVLWLTGKYLRDMRPAATLRILRARELFRERFAQIKLDMEKAGKAASVEELLGIIVYAHPISKDRATLRSFIEPTNESTRISFTAAFSREEEDPSGTPLMSRFDQDIVDSIRRQRDVVHSPERDTIRPHL